MQEARDALAPRVLEYVRGGQDRAVQSLTRPLLRSLFAPSPVFTLTFALSHRRDPVLVCDGCGDCEPPVGGRVVPLALPQPRATLPVRGH